MIVNDQIVYRIVPIRDGVEAPYVGQVIPSPDSRTFENYSEYKRHIEAIFETVRKSEFNKIQTSRLNSLFVCKSIDDAKYLWANAYETDYFYILDLSVTGELNWFDAQFFNKCKLNSTEKESQANALNYWQSISNVADSFDIYKSEVEGLLVGNATIIECNRFERERHKYF